MSPGTEKEGSSSAEIRLTRLGSRWLFNSCHFCRVILYVGLGCWNENFQKSAKEASQICSPMTFSRVPDVVFGLHHLLI
jgi:hypothetical protein